MTTHYSDVSFVGTLAFGAGQTQSPIFSCINLPTIGTGQFLRLDFPSNWGTSDVTFNVYNALDDVAVKNLCNFDGVNKEILKIPGVTALDSIPLFAHWFATVRYFSITSSMTQTTSPIVGIVLQPIIQGQA